MTRRLLTGVGWALGGLIVALVLTFGAFAMAGQELSKPASAPVLSSNAGPTGEDGKDASRSPEPDQTKSPSPSSDDHGGGSNDSSGSGSDSDSSGSGSGDDSSDDSSGSGDEEHGDD